MDNESKKSLSPFGSLEQLPCLDDFHPRHSLPKVPTLQDLLEHIEPLKDTSPTRSLYAVYHHEDPRRLVMDLRRKPDKYPAALDEVLQKLLRGTKYDELPQRERTLIDDAVLRYFEKDPPPPPKPKVVHVEEDRPKDDETPPEEPMGPVDQIRAFFWL